MSSETPLETPLLISQRSVAVLQTRTHFCGSEFIPGAGPFLVVSNHRSFMDPLLLMVAAKQSIRFACHHYMSRVPGLRWMVQQLGCLPLESGPKTGQQAFFQRAVAALQQGEPIGIFPEGGAAMISPQPIYRVGEFNRGFAHLALRAQVPQLQVVPMALLALTEMRLPALPLQWFSLFAPSEPLFQGEGFHPILVYQQVMVLVGQPWVITPQQQQDYGQQASRHLVQDLTAHCQTEVQRLLKQGYWG
jgi:1-acyl-sn-glycerol-3-phosphate acyltransferase